MAYTAVVTGASGFLGSELVKQLLERGWDVRGTMRDSCSKTADQLHRLAAALPGSLTLYDADLLVPGDFDAACSGADFVFHCASPFFIDAADPVVQLVTPAVAGTRNVLASCAKAKVADGRLRRVVVTSSFAACKGRAPGCAPPLNGDKYTEEDWNETSTAETEAYWYGKVQAERAAWACAKESGLDLVTICPEFIMGPPLCATVPDPTSVGFFKGWLEGKASSGPCTFAPDVRDVARAHWLAATIPSASGRYIVANPVSHSPAFIERTLRTRFPTWDIPHGEECAEESTVDASKAGRELGLVLTPMDQVLIDMALVLVRLGIATPTLRR